MSRTRTIAAGSVVILIVIVAAVVLITRPGNHDAAQSGDAGLKHTADVVAPAIAQHAANYPGVTFIDVLHHYLLDLQTSLTKQDPRLVPAGTLVQVQVYDPSSTPPQDLGLNAPGHAFVSVGLSAVKAAARTPAGVYVTTSAGQRVYVRPLSLPQIFAQQGVIGVIEVVGSAGGQ